MERFGRYIVEAEIGRGGMGRVVRARDPATGALRALKVLDHASDPELVARFRREAEALARVGQATGVAIHEVGQEGTRLYYAMDLLEGGSLAERLRRSGKVPWREAVALVARLARSVARCHALGVVHRDLKPANVLFDATGAPLLADFGCARDLAAASLTETGTTLGTPGYMAPEQLEGGRGDAPCDVYALGVILRELATGARPYAGSSWRDLLARARGRAFEPVARSVGAPAALDALLARVLAAGPELRPSASVMASELEGLLAGKAAPGARRRAGALILVVVAALAVLALVTRGGARPGEVAVGRGKPAGERRDLESLVTRGETAELARLASDAVVFPLETVRSLARNYPKSAALAGLELVAAAATKDPRAVEEAHERARGKALEGLAARLRDGVAVVARIARKLPEYRDATATFTDADREQLKPLDALSCRPELLAGALASLAPECRRVLDDSYGGISDALSGILARLELSPSTVALLPPEIAVAWLARRAQSADDCARVESLAEKLESRGDVALAAHAYAAAFRHRSPDSLESQEDLERADVLFAGASGLACAPAARSDLQGRAHEVLRSGHEVILAQVRSLVGRYEGARTPEKKRIEARKLVVCSLLLDGRERAASLAALPALDADDPVDMLLDRVADLEITRRMATRAIAAGHDEAETMWARTILARVLRVQGDESAARQQLSLPTSWTKDGADTIHVFAARRATFLAFPLDRRNEKNPLVWGPESLAHGPGSREEDGWEARPGRDTETRIALAYGPYTKDVPAGNHVVRFALLAPDDPHEDAVVATIDVMDKTTGRLLAARDVKKGDFGAPREGYTDFALAFRSDASHELEFRTWWRGVCSLRSGKVVIGR